VRHRKDNRKLGRTSEHREAMLRNVVQGLFEHGRIQTTVPKAKEARRLAERCITIAKKGLSARAAVVDQLPPLKAAGEQLRQQLATAGSDEEKQALHKQIESNGRRIMSLNAKGEHYRRLCLQKLHQKAIVKRLFEEIAPRYTERNGGYTRILKAGYRLGDKSPLAVFELV
jgi:large subunit ribosomal protein L17